MNIAVKLLKGNAISYINKRINFCNSYSLSKIIKDQYFSSQIHNMEKFN